MSVRVTPARLWVAAILILLLLPSIMTSVQTAIATKMCVYAVLALSYGMVAGQLGLLSFCHALPFAIGGFAVVNAIRLSGGAIPPVLAPVIGALGGMAAGWLLGALLARLSGVVVAVASLCLTELFFATTPFLGFLYGGFIDRTRMGPGFGLDLAHGEDTFRLIALWAVAATLLVHAIAHTPLGAMARAVRDNPVRAALVGFDPVVVRRRHMALSGAVAGIAGALFLLDLEFMTLAEASTLVSTNVVLMTFVGGAATRFGPILGAVLFVGIQSGIGFLTTSWPLLLGLLFLGTVLWAPEGLAGLAGTLSRRVADRHRKH